MTNINTFQGDVFIHEYIKHSGDDNTYFGFSGNDTFTIATGGTGRLTINSAGNVTLGVDLYIPDNIHHVGDAGTYFGFSANDTFTISTASTVRFTVNSAGTVTLANSLVIPDYVYHSGDNDTYIGFSAANTIVMRTAGTNRLSIGSAGEVSLSNALYIPGYIYHVGDNNTYIGFSAADTIVMRTAGANRLTVSSAGNVSLSNGLYVPAYIYHVGDNNTYFGFSGNDTFTIATSGTARLTIGSTGTVTIPGTINYGGTDLANSATITASVSAGNNTIVRRHGSGYVFANYFNTTPDDVSTGVTKVCVETGNDGYIRHGTVDAIRTFIGATSADTASTVAMRDGSGDLFARLFRADYQNQSTCTGAIAFRTSTSDNYIRFCSDASAIRTFIGCLASNGTAATATKVQVSRDDTGDTANYLVFAPTATAGQHNLQMDTNLIYDNTNNRLRLKQVMFGDQNVYGLGAVAGQYGSVGTVGTGKNSYEGLNVNGHWVIGMTNGTASCGIYDDTLNRWCTRWYSGGSTNLYYNNSDKFQTTNTGAHVTGDLYADHIYIDDWLYHTGDDDTRIGFGGNTIYMRTGGTNRLTISNAGSVDLQAGLYIPHYVYHVGDNNTYFGFPGNDTIRFRTSGADRISINSDGRVLMGTNSHSATNGTLIIYSKAGVLQDQFVFKAYSDTNVIGFFLNAAGGQRGMIGGATNSVSYQTTSDVRLKKQIKPMGSTLDRVNTLKPSTYTWIRDEAKGFGFIAQEVFEVFPEMKPVVPYSGCTCKCSAERCESCPLCDDEHDYPKHKDGNDFYYGLDYAMFTPYLTKAIQELDVKVEEKHNRKSLVTDIEYSAVSDYEGLVVSASTNEYKNGRPVLKLSNIENDKKSYGVILGKAKSVDNETNVQKSGDGRLWVVNTAGKLESGDLVTTSNISGYGKKQDDDILRSYTLVKVTQDCGFTEQYTPVKRVKQEMKDVTYYLQENYVKVLDMKTVKEEDVIERELPMYVKSLEGREDFDTQVITPEISEEEYEALTEEEKESYTISYKKYITPYEYNRITEAEKTFYQETTQTNNYTKELYESSKPMPACCEEYTTVVRQELVDVLDDNDQLVWEETNEMELVYKIRYLDASGAQTDEANTVHKAAFVGCTYHCG